jgi:glutamate formiminotransferase / formiminotetrahydrofolate cyclodeaminase
VSERTRPLVEIVPNFSEGRRQDVIDAILAALRVPGVTMLNEQWDPDHNRLDASLVGSPEAVKRSALAGAAKAAELIDMTQHRGSHPRMGAVDVIPFLPVRDVSMEDCVSLARDVARQIGEDLRIPVYCYEHAALSPERRSLADVRKGEYEGLKADVAVGKRLPDFGPQEIGKAGAVAVGARKPLVAFNVYLAGTDERTAKDIARRVREATGGLKNVRAIGFFVPERGCLTVSMNLVDTDATPIYRAFEMVKMEASRYGLPVISTEIVGLVPQAAIAETASFSLQLEGFDPAGQILETVVQRAAESEGEPTGTAGRSVSGLLDVMASDAPTPGGGTAAATAAAMAAALVGMVARLTIGRKGFDAVEARMSAIAAEADAARPELLVLADRDAQAFDGVMAAYRMPKETDHEKSVRSKAIQAAMTAAAEAPAAVARLAMAVLGLAREVTDTGNANAASDGATAGHLAHAAVEGALANVEINLASLKDAEVVAGLQAEVDDLRARSAEAAVETAAAFRRRISG